MEEPKASTSPTPGNPAPGSTGSPAPEVSAAPDPAPRWDTEKNMSSIILRTCMRIVMPLALLFAIYSALKGHNSPGGGFIAGLIASVSLCLFRMASGPKALYELFPFHPRGIVVVGLALAAITAMFPFFLGLPVMQSGDMYAYLGKEKIHLVSAMGFDTGVLLVVIGVSVGMITRLSEELED